MANARLTRHFRVIQTLPIEDWWRQTGSNRRPPACKAGALPAELCPHVQRTQVLACRLGVLVSAKALTITDTSDNGGSGWIRTNDPRLIKTVL